MMHRFLGAGFVSLLIGFGASASACPAPSSVLLFHSCWGEAAARVLLLPEQADALAPPQNEALRLVVTGGYTGKDRRGENLPKPVGLFVHRAAIINPNLGRMDGILLVHENDLAVERRTDVRWDGQRWDLSVPEQRAAFAKQASGAGVSVLQSHLLISVGTLDVREQEDAPKHVRRLLITDEQGYGVYQTDRAVTLFEAATAVLTTLSPTMALNLDMGSYDYCIRDEGDATTNCGVLGRRQTDRLSNVLEFTLTQGD